MKSFLITAIIVLFCLRPMAAKLFATVCPDCKQTSGHSEAKGSSKYCRFCLEKLARKDEPIKIGGYSNWLPEPFHPKAIGFFTVRANIESDALRPKASKHRQYVDAIYKYEQEVADMMHRFVVRRLEKHEYVDADRTLLSIDLLLQRASMRRRIDDMIKQEA